MRIACLLAEGFEDSEFRVPFDRFLEAGHEVAIIGNKAGAKLEGKKGTESVTTHASIDEARPDAFGALFIPGGHSPDQLRGDERFVQFTRAFANKPILAICHGPQLLITADMVRGRRMTAWKTVQVDLRNAGANVVDAEVVVDKNLVTSRKPDDLEAFVRESMKLLVNGAVAHAR
jgi:protease I